jgi:hypothetical protein
MTNLPFPPERLSLFDRGPVHTLWRRAGLARPDNSGPARLWLALVAVAWLPLLILSLLEGKTYGAPAGSSVLSDWGLTARLLIQMPLLIALQPVVDRHLGRIAHCFYSTAVVSAGEIPGMVQIISSTRRLAHSSTAELILVALAIGQSSLLTQRALAMGGLHWVFADAAAATLSPAGWWTVYVAMPLATVVTFRWVWRIGLWWRFCWQTSRLDLQLIPSHPDRAGGLGFLSLSLMGFSMVAAGLLSSIAGQFATRILAQGAGLDDLKFQFAGSLAAVMLLFVGPLLLFTGSLLRAKIAGIERYGGLACRHGRAFENRWLTPEKVIDEGSLEVPDFSARTDLNQVGELVYEMRGTVFQFRHLVALAAVAASPFLPVALLLVPAKEVLLGLAGLFL